MNQRSSSMYITVFLVYLVQFVLLGASSFTVHFADAAKLKPGDTVLIRRPVTEAWVRFMGMDDETLSRNGKKGTWLRPGTWINADRIVKSVSGYRITLDVPLSDSYDAKYTRRWAHDCAVQISRPDQQYRL